MRRQNKGSCPIHGDKYMAKEGAAYYCAAPTPGEMSSKCFYHPRASHPKEAKRIIKKRAEEKKGTPNFWKVMEDEWKRKKENRKKAIAAYNKKKLTLASE